jgi:hypothetical protein
LGDVPGEWSRVALLAYAAVLLGLLTGEPDHRQCAPHGCINRGLMPEWMQIPASDFHFVECVDGGDGAAKILQIVHERIHLRYGLDPIRDIQVLCPI